MRQSMSFMLFAVLVSHVYSAPQFISFKDGKIGVNFAGFHASAGLGGLAGGGAGSGGLFAEAGTPFGQSARAGLGGNVDQNGQSSGGLYAGATAGGNVRAQAGLGGGVTGEKTAGTGFAEAQAGNRYAASGLGGEKSIEGSSGFTFSGSKSFGLSSGVDVAKETEVAAPAQPVYVEAVKPVYKKVHTEVNLEADNEIKPLPLTPARADFSADVNVKAEAPATVIVKEVEYHPPPPPPPPPAPVHVIEKQIYRVRTKPHHHHFRKTAFVGGYIGADGDVAPPPPPPAAVVYKELQPVIHKRIDVAAESGVKAGADAEAHADTNANAGLGGQYTYRKRINVQSNPTFFQDIFNIPISTLNAVGKLLGNAASGTSVSVQKSASIQADSDSISPKHVQSPSSLESSGETQISVQTPTVSKVIEDIFANTKVENIAGRNSGFGFNVKIAGCRAEFGFGCGYEYEKRVASVTCLERPTCQQGTNAQCTLFEIMNGYIPINTLSAVNKFLQNNVPARKTVEVSGDGSESTRVRLGPHARRRANKHVVIVQESNDKVEAEPRYEPQDHQ